MADNSFFVKLGVIIKPFLDGMKEASKGVDGLFQNIKRIDSTGIKGISSEFEKIGEKTKLVASNIGQVSTDISTEYNKMADTLKGVGKNISDVGDKSKKTGAEVSSSFDGVQGATNNLKGGLEGVVEQVVVVGKAARVSGKAMKSALISTGVGALLVVLLEIAANWDKISEFVGLTNKKLENQQTLLKSSLSIIDAEVKTNESRLKFAKDQNIAAEGLKKIQKTLLEQKAVLLVASISNLNARILEEESAARELSTWGKIANIRSFVKQEGSINTEEQVEIDKLKIALEKVKAGYTDVIGAILKFNKAAGDGKITPEIDTSKFSEAISTLKLQLEKLKESFSGSATLEDQSENLSKRLEIEEQIIEESFNKRLALIGKSGESELKIANDKEVALLQLRRSYKNLESNILKSDISKNLAIIKLNADLTTKERLDALAKEFNALGSATREQIKKYNADKQAIKNEGHNAEILAENEYFKGLIDNEIAVGNERIEIERKIQENLAKLRGETFNINTGDLTVTLDKLKNFGEAVKELIEGSISSSFMALGEAIGNALASGGNVLKSVGNAILGSIGGFLSKMGKLLIEYGTMAVIKGKLDIAIASLPGPGTIAAGVAAIAAGIALSAAGAAFSSALSGGGSSSVGGASSSSGGGVSTSSVSRSGSSTFEGRVVFEIAGDKLVGVLNNTSLGNLRVGDSDQLITTG